MTLKKTPYSRIVRLLGAALLVVAAIAIPVKADEISSLQIVDRSSNYAVGAVSGDALTLSVEGVGEVAFGAGAGYVAYHRSTETIRIPVIPENLLVACSTADAVSVSSTGRCVGRAQLRSAGFDVADSSKSVLEDSLFQAGITQRRTSDAKSNFRSPLSSGPLAQGLLASTSEFLASQLGMKPDESTPPANPQGFARAAAALVPDLASSQAVCDARVGGGAVADTANVLVLAEPLAPVIRGTAARASCDIARGEITVPVRPDLLYGYGEIDLEVVANESILGATPAQVDALLETLANAVPPAVRETIEDLRLRIESQPLVTISLAPGKSEVSTTEQGAVSDSLTGDVEIEILGGLATILVSRSHSVASVVDGVPSTQGTCALATVSVLNLSTPQPDDVIVNTVECPSQAISLLGGLPEPLGDSLKIDIASGKIDDNTQCDGPRCQARSGASVLSISMFGGELPNVLLKLASTAALAEVSIQSEATKVALPVTGGTAGVLGLFLAAAAVLVRRRIR